jgi:hypothetical protein
MYHNVFHEVFEGCFTSGIAFMIAETKEDAIILLIDQFIERMIRGERMLRKFSEGRTINPTEFAEELHKAKCEIFPLETGSGTFIDGDISFGSFKFEDRKN